MISRLLRTPLTWIAIAVLAAGSVFGLYWFQPWKLVTDTEVAEPLSTVATVVSSGEFVSHEYETSGSARIVRTDDGRHRLELVGLSTSNGPDLRVWLTDQPVLEGSDGWHVFDDGHWIELGRLKGNRGDQGYDIPAGVDLDALTSISIWCKRFAVSFGAAPLDRAG
ncbi:DM13 domain-containing protein [Micromonospora sp. NPDC051296]|uniref:DM13 domain-containing protein n=1 Tax=Micromonospora sp. NPDC051296 TaxID=3155046 RepID=UPI00341D8F65